MSLPPSLTLPPLPICARVIAFLTHVRLRVADANYKISHSTRGDTAHQSYSCGVMSKDNECECICMEEKFVSKDEL